MFPQIQKSSMNCQKQGGKKQSFKCSVESSICDIAAVEFKDIDTWKPYDWFILNKLDESIILGQFFKKTFNENKTAMELQMSKTGQISITIAGLLINLSEYFKPNKVQYTARSLPAIFRCTRLIKHCHGYEIKTYDDQKFATSFNCTKEVCKVGKQSMNAIRISSNTKSKTSVRWDKDIICMAYMTLNKWLHLPSEKMLKIYKNAVHQGPGIIPEMMLWMLNEGKRQIKLDEGYYGGLILDELAIQEDLQLVNTKECSAS
ncbi:unnamed protein product [Mytilus coruscus]|uniref:Uncharacterized protein n=1 Tax=Mytilus coruscus TaxID=42192 RepID=A0A6J8EGK2_MYTCO|nr:unnamed protein product [Mytilus coruscus]